MLKTERELIQSMAKKNPIKKWVEDLEPLFPNKTYRWPTGT